MPKWKEERPENTMGKSSSQMASGKTASAPHTLEKNVSVMAQGEHVTEDGDNALVSCRFCFL